MDLTELVPSVNICSCILAKGTGAIRDCKDSPRAPDRECSRHIFPPCSLLTWSEDPAWGSSSCPWWLPRPFWTILKVKRGISRVCSHSRYTGLEIVRHVAAISGQDDGVGVALVPGLESLVPEWKEHLVFPSCRVSNRSGKLSYNHKTSLWLWLAISRSTPILGLWLRNYASKCSLLFPVSTG